MSANPDSVPTAIYNGCEVPAHTVAALTKAHEGKPLAALNGDAQPILDRLEAGESSMEIAASIGISRISLYAWLVRHCPDQWQAICAARQLHRLDECEDTLDSPLPIAKRVYPDGSYTESVDSKVDNANVTRARDKARMAQWHLERANRKLFGDAKSLNLNDGQPIVVVHQIVMPGGAAQPALPAQSVTIEQAKDTQVIDK
jgi:hypothetical protein